MKQFNLMLLAALFLASPSVFSKEEMDHSMHKGQAENGDHSQHAGHSKKAAPGELKSLAEVPVSGRARKAGSDGRYAMEPTSVNDSLSALCAKGSRGIVMLDRVTIDKCGGRTKGMPVPASMKKKVDHSQH